MKWVNVVGILFEFFSFWLVAPEILGEERLKSWEERLETGIGILPKIVVTLLSLFLVATAGYIFFGFIIGRRLIEFALLSEATGVVFVFLMSLAFMIGWNMERRLVPRLLRTLRDDAKFRERCLAVGAMLFVIGTAFQLIATLGVPS